MAPGMAAVGFGVYLKVGKKIWWPVSGLPGLFWGSGPGPWAPLGPGPPWYPAWYPAKGYRVALRDCAKRNLRLYKVIQNANTSVAVVIIKDITWRHARFPP